MENSRDNSIQWKVRGPMWAFHLTAPANSCPVELCTLVLEQIWSEDGLDAWQRDMLGDLEIREDAGVTLGIFLAVSNSKMEDSSEHLMIPTPLVLANAGLHSEATRLFQAWGRLSPDDQLRDLLVSLQNAEAED